MYAIRYRLKGLVIESRGVETRFSVPFRQPPRPTPCCRMGTVAEHFLYSCLLGLLASVTNGS